MYLKAILFLFLCSTVQSCSKDKKSITITDFTKVYTDSIFPDDKSYLGYTTYYVEIKGEVNDSIMFEFVKKRWTPFLL